jgi:hypothetical protein
MTKLAAAALALSFAMHAAPAKASLPGRSRDWSLPQLDTSPSSILEWNGKTLRFPGEKIVAHQQVENGNGLLIVTDRAFHWFSREMKTARNADARMTFDEMRVENNIRQSLCALILADGKIVAIGTPEGIALYEFTNDHGILRTRPRGMPIKAETCELEKVDRIPLSFLQFIKTVTFPVEPAFWPEVGREVMIMAR